MSTAYLATYLNDHLAGAMVAVELLDHLETTHAGTDVSDFAAALKADVEADRQELIRIMHSLAIEQSRTRQATAWLGEKMGRLKLRFDDPSGGSFLLFEILELLSLGIEGKAGLWKALSAAAVDHPALLTADYAALLQRALAQRERVEDARLRIARLTLIPDTRH